jgi:hypothetical protein
MQTIIRVIFGQAIMHNHRIRLTKIFFEFLGIGLHL